MEVMRTERSKNEDVKEQHKIVKRLEKDGMTYGWHIAMKSNRISDSREYVNYRNGKTVVEEYKLDRLPKAAQSFVKEHEESIFTDERESTGFAVYIYR